MTRIYLPQRGVLAASLTVLVLPLLLLIPGCSRKGDEAHDDHHHDEEPRTVQITVWSERHEIFAEHHLVAAGTPTKFVTHVTDLKSLEPRRDGPIKFALRPINQADTPSIEQVENAPTRPGIYEPMLQFPKPGDWNVSIRIPTDDGEQVVTLPSVKVFATKHDADHGDAPEAPEGITFLKEQQWKIGAKTEPVSRRRLVERVRVPATATARPGSLAQVTPPLPGRLIAPAGRMLPVVGDRVSAGETLALLQPSYSDLAVRLAEADAELARAGIDLEQAELTFQRIQKLAEVEAKSGRELQEAQFALKSAQARLTAARKVQAALPTSREKTTDADGTTPVIPLNAPIAGMIVAQSDTALGQWVTPDKSLFTVLDAGKVFIEGRVPEALAYRLGHVKRASAELPGEPMELLPLGEEGGGRLVFLSPQVDPKSRTVAIVFEAENRANRLRVGQQLFLHLETGQAEEALAIPVSALVEEGGVFVAFVQVAGETFQKRDLRLGLKDADFVQVLDGLKEGERVVTRGAYAIRLASASSVIPAHGHTH